MRHIQTTAITILLSVFSLSIAAEDGQLAQRMNQLCSRYSASMIEVARKEFQIELEVSASSVPRLDEIADIAGPAWKAGGPAGKYAGLNNQMGCFLAEVIAKTYGGTWVQAKVEGMGGQFAMRLSDGSLVWPISRAEKRLALGAEESIQNYFDQLGKPK